MKKDYDAMKKDFDAKAMLMKKDFDANATVMKNEFDTNATVMKNEFDTDATVVKKDLVSTRIKFCRQINLPKKSDSCIAIRTPAEVNTVTDNINGQKFLF